MKKNNRAFSLIELSIVIIIIGILIAGVTQGSRLIDASKVQTAQTTTESSPVASIRGLVLWLESTKEESFPESQLEDGANIDEWFDNNPQVTNGHDFAITTASDNVEYKTKGINGLPSVKFSGSQTAANSPTGTSITTPYLAYTVFVVYQQDGFDTNNALLYNGTSATAATGFGIEDNTSGFIVLHEGEDSAAFTPVDGDLLARSDTARIAAVTVSANSVDGSAATQGVKIFINGEADFASAESMTSNIVTPGAGTNLTVGIEDGATDVTMTGQISEVIIIDHVLRKSDRQAIEGYLGQKYGISVVKDTVS